MEDGFVDVENIDHNQPPLVGSTKPARPPNVTGSGASGNGTRRSTRARPPIGTYANLRRRSFSPDGGFNRRSSGRLNSKNPKGRRYDGPDRHHPGGPKLKLKFGERSGVGTSFLGPWDRDLDSDDDDLAFEEQFILRMPEGEDCERLREMVAKRDVAEDVWFKFKDSRRAIFHIGETSYNAKLVDLPAVIEAQKTLDNRQMFKVADICQMLLVESPVDAPITDANGAANPPETSKAFDVKDFIWPHGLTPPLRHVRKRRFRKRVNRATIETVEKEVERLLGEDAIADQTTFSLHSSHSEASDSDYGAHIFEAGTPGFEGVGSPRPAGDGNDSGGSEKGDDLFDDDAFDAAFAAEIDQVDLDAAAEDAYADDESRSSGEGEDDGELFGDEDETDDSDEDEDEEAQAARRLLAEEIRDLEAAVDKKVAEISTVQNPLIKRRFEDALKKLQADLDSRLLQRQQMSERKMAQDQARAQLEFDSLNVGSTSAQAQTAQADEEEGAADGDEDEEDGDGDEEDAEDEDVDVVDDTPIKESGTPLPVPGPGPATSALNAMGLGMGALGGPSSQYLQR